MKEVLKEAQSLAVKRAEVEFHNFASLGEPDRAIAHYAEENTRRAAVIRQHEAFIGEMTPFLEIGSNVGHSSYMLANEFSTSGFALDLSADSLRYGATLQDRWHLSRAPVRIAGDALNLPFADGSLRLVMEFQMLSQFMNIESVFLEVMRVLAPGGVFLFAEEPLKRLLTLRLYRCPYYDTMKPWERKAHEWGLLGFLVRDHIGAHQEESFGIRQNQSMGLEEWHELISRHFAEAEYQIFVPGCGWGERIVKQAVIRMGSQHSERRAARLLGGTLAAVCRKRGEREHVVYNPAEFQDLLRCPDCHGKVRRSHEDALECLECGLRAANEGGVYNLLPSGERAELYPGDRGDVIDFCLASHADRLLDGWYKLEGVFGNKYRWIGERASAHLSRVKSGAHRLRIRGYVSEGHPVELSASANGRKVGRWKLDRSGLFVVEAGLPDGEEYRIDIQAGPTWTVPTDDRILTLNLSMIRLVPRE